jgi:ribosomal protein L28
VTFSNKHNRKWQEPNLQYKKVFWEQGQRWVKLRICTKVCTQTQLQLHKLNTGAACRAVCTHSAGVCLSSHHACAGLANSAAHLYSTC